MTTQDLQVRLAEHFRLVRANRASDAPVFGLEHGLSPADRDGIAEAVRASAPSRSLRDKVWLVWVAHATEVAYAYTGEEYWQSFAQATPGWDDRNREWIRTTFERFQEEFGGAIPQGRWASWFRIIAWPITNAIIPTDLQRHLARSLYELRGQLARYVDSPRALGAYVAKSAWHGSDRFQNLKEQPDILGQVAHALLRPQATASQLLLPVTTRRLVDDLQAHRESRGWLKQARAVVERDIRTRGPRSKGLPDPDHPRRQSELSPVSERLRAVRPQLVLRRQGDGSWAPTLRLPYLGHFVGEIAELRTTFKSSRSWLPAAEAMVAPGRLLYDDQDVLLTRWPHPDEPLIRFSEPASGLEAAVMSSWVLPPEPWAFKADKFGTARLLERPSIRPGGTYLVASRGSITSVVARRAVLSVPGAHLYAIDLDATSLDVAMPELSRLRLSTSLAIDSYPVGVPVIWDGQGFSEWLTNDEPTFAVVSDHDVRTLTFAVEGESRTVANVRAWSPVIVSLPNLPEGDHELRLTEGGGVGAASLSMQIRVRAPRSTGPERHGPLSGWIDPFTDRLDDLWGGQSALSVVGANRRAVLSFALGVVAGADPLATVNFDVELPLQPEAWRSLLDEIKKSRSLADAFDDSRWARVVVSAGPYGRCSFEFHRSVSPIRWRVNRRKDPGLRLVDETDSESPLTVSRASFQEPTIWKPVPTSDFAYRGSERVLSSPDDGLFSVVSGRHRASVIVKSQATFRDFRDLHLSVGASTPESTVRGIEQLLSDLKVWASATLTGSRLGEMWRALVVRQLHHAVISAICGRGWREAESAALDDPAALARLKNNLLTTARLPDAAIPLLDGADRIAGLVVHERVERFRPIALQARHESSEAFGRLGEGRLAADRELAELVLRLATDPNVAEWAGEALAAGLQVMLDWPVLLKVGRFIAIAGLDHPTSDRYPPLVPGWDWR